MLQLLLHVVKKPINSPDLFPSWITAVFFLPLPVKHSVGVGVQMQGPEENKGRTENSDLKVSEGKYFCLEHTGALLCPALVK